MRQLLLDEGRPIVLAGDDQRALGPWARSLAAAIVADERSGRTERGREYARDGRVHTVRVSEGLVTATVEGTSVGGYDVSISAAPVPRRLWAEIARSPRGQEHLELAVETGRQSIHFEHEMLVDWGEPLTPRHGDVRRSCTCVDGESHGRNAACKHAAALALVFAQAVDDDPTLLLRFRGWTGTADGEVPHAPPSERDLDPWAAGELPVPRPVRPMPVGAVLKRLGPSGLHAGAGTLEDALLPAYETFSGLTWNAEDRRR